LKGLGVKESGALLYEFYKKLTASDAPVKERAFQEYYMVERTLTEAMVEHLSELYSSGEHKAFTLRHFKALHSFSGKEYGWPQLQMDPTFQVLRTPFNIVCMTIAFANEHVVSLCALFQLCYAKLVVNYLKKQQSVPVGSPLKKHKGRPSPTKVKGPGSSFEHPSVGNQCVKYFIVIKP
jgi:hypothetical protein